MAIRMARIRQPVKRLGAERYLRLTLVSFAASVILTRLYLSLTGYPQLGSGTLHIAHLLWGGLLLFAAAVLPLILANRWVYPTSGVLSGIGVGLFIDEVGKFITRSNDYFYPAAAPIIYAAFLLTVLLYLRVARAPAFDDRAELYRAFDDMSEVLDHDLEPHERADLVARLGNVAGRSTSPEYVRLAQVLLEFLQSDAATMVVPAPSRLDRLIARTQAIERKYLDQARFRAVLVTGLTLLGLASLGTLALSGAALTAPGLLPSTGPASARAVVRNDEGSAVTPAYPGEPLSANRPVHPAASTFRSRVALWLRLGLEGLVGLLLLAGAFSLLRRKDQRGVLWGYYGLLLALTTVNLLVFYFDQFGAAAETLVQFGLLEGLIHYRRRYLIPVPAPAGPRRPVTGDASERDVQV